MLPVIECTWEAHFLSNRHSRHRVDPSRTEMEDRSALTRAASSTATFSPSPQSLRSNSGPWHTKENSHGPCHPAGCTRMSCASLSIASSTPAATGLIVCSADGVLRRCRNLCLSAMLEAVRASSGRPIDIDLVNRVLLQPHWQNEVDLTDF